MSADNATLGGVRRANFLGVPAAFNLNHEMVMVNEAFGHVGYLVGSCIDNREYRDVDVRMLLPDAEYDRMFPGITKNQQMHPLWSLLCASISEWLSARTGLPIDFQIQRRADANEMYPYGKRQALGLFFRVNAERTADDAPRSGDD